MSERMSPQQRVVWDLGREARHVVRVRVTGAPEAALQRVASRHDVLRTRFTPDARLKYPLQELGEPLELQYSRVGNSVELSLPALHADAATMRLLVEAWEAELRGPRRDAEITYQQFSAWKNDITPEPRASLQDAPALPYEGTAQTEHRHGERRLPPDLTRGLRELARGCEVRLEAVCLSVFAALLARLSERDEVVFALENAGRAFEDVRDLLGPVARWHPLALRVGRTFDRDQLRRVETTLRDLEEDDAPMTDPSSLPRALGFAFRSFVGSGDFQIEHASIEQPGPRQVLAVHEMHDGLSLSLRYQAMSEASAELWLAQYEHGLREIVGRLPQRLRFESRTSEPFASKSYPSLQSEFARHAAQHPHRLALVCGDEQLTYAELDRRASHVARKLAPIAAGTPIGLWAERKASSIVGLLAILKAGGAYVPLDPEAPRERLRQQLLGIETLLARGPLDLPLNVITIEGEGDSLATPTHPDQLACMIFTSGSTGTPKAVMITERGIASYTQAVLGLLALPEGMHFATVSTLSADLGNTSVFGALASGGCLHVIDYDTATDGARFATYCARWPLDVLKIVPSHLAALLDAGADVLPKRALLCGGEALAPSFRQRVQQLAPELALYNHYGPTETTVGAVALPMATLQDDRGCASIPIGRPLTNAEALVLDEEGQLAATGVSGELFLGGDGLARGYHQRPELTAERFVPHPFADGRRLYRTGDRARYRPDGTIEFLGRRDHQLKIRGFRVELGEIEAQLGSAPQCSAAAVIAKPSAAGGHALFGFFAARGDVDLIELRSFLSERLPDYMIPSELIALDALPRNRNGKVDRQELARRADERTQRSYRAPSDETERVLCKLWAELLNVPRVGVDDDFFALGGHSLLAIPLIHRIREELGGALPLQAIFDAPTVAQLARALHTASGLTTLRSEGNAAPVFCFDPTGLHAHAYRALADQLDGPVHVLSSLDLNGSALATRLVAHAQGPYRLVGWSLGGVLALATARELERMGHTVELLCILDTDPRIDLIDLDPVVELAAYLTEAEGDALRAREDLHDPLRSTLRDLAGAERITAAVRWAQAQQLIADDVEPALYEARYAQLRAASLFVKELPAQTLAAPVLAFWSAVTRTRRGDALPSWQHYTRGAVEVRVVPGDHEAVLVAPDVLATLGVRLD